MQQPSQSYAVRNDVTLVVRVYESLWKACLSQRAVSAKDSLKDRKGDNTKLKSQKTVTEWTAWGFLWPSLVWRCSVSRFVFSCVVTPSSPKRSVWRVYWKFHALHWFFLCLGFLEIWKRPGPSGPESDDCELASEPIYTLWADIFNFRYFSSANFDWNLWQKEGICDAEGRIQVFPRRFRAIWIFVLECVTSSSQSRNYLTGYLCCCFFFKILFQKNVLRVAPHWTASLYYSRRSLLCEFG